ncbi:hypothetical protein LTR78_005906 [Recurvomyces mirabilis]|uniref:Uncharacterized protein n=1 Tax=Recurvomyces mirabilis TaxID=574656 RepID=A0AAE0WLR1_9PEZI|nr:hypothetical protein LTR78_005906 [Recurvomyces mirabilis]KAK5155284.1 hypothetical protein LTS14_006239 [Recurvomyces mirabilis]
MKRSVENEVPDDGSRKAIRLSDGVIPPPQSLTRPDKELVLGHVYNACDLYDELLPYVGRQSREGSKRAQAVVEVTDAIHDILADAQRKIDEQWDKLLQATREFAAHAVQGSYAYERGNLLSLSTSTLETTLLYMDCSDKKRYTTYACKILRESATIEPLDEEDGFQYYDGQRIVKVSAPHPYIEKAMKVVGGTIGDLNPSGTLRALITLYTTLGPGCVRVRMGERSRARSCVDRAIRALVDPSNIQPQNIECHQGDCEGGNHQTCFRSIEVGRLRWMEDPDMTGPPSYWDFASVLRELKASYSEATCEYDGDRSDEADEDESYTRACFHKDSIDLLEWLQKKAWQEVRTKVATTAGSRLPVELVDQIMECALHAESIPLEPTVRTMREPETPESVSKYGFTYFKQKVLKQEYECETTKNPSYDIRPELGWVETRLDDGI